MGNDIVDTEFLQKIEFNTHKFHKNKQNMECETCGMDVEEYYCDDCLSCYDCSCQCQYGE